MSTSNFEVMLADTSEALRIHYRLRYRVFCLETGFEDAAKFPDQQEQDKFDAQAAHFIVRDTASGDWLAAARLILPGAALLPIERHGLAAGAGNRDIGRYFQQPTAEVSRLLITDADQSLAGWPSRACLQDPLARMGSLPHSRRHERKPVIMHKLLRALAAYAVECDIPQAAFFITRPLVRIISRMGIELIPIGTPFQHRGIRYPFVIDTSQAYNVLHEENLLTAEWIVPYQRFSELPLAITRQAA